MARRVRTFADRNAEFLTKYGISIRQGERYARELGLPARSAARAARALTSTERGLAIAPEAAIEMKVTAANALAAVRRGDYADVPEAERAYGLVPGTVAAQIPQGVRRRGGEFVARPHDRAPVPVRVIAKDVGDTLVLTRGDRVRRLAAEHRRAVDHYLRTGDDADLKRFRGKRIGGVELETRLNFLNVLYDAGRVEGGPYPEARPR